MTGVLTKREDQDTDTHRGRMILGAWGSNTGCDSAPALKKVESQVSPISESQALPVRRWLRLFHILIGFRGTA